MAIRPVHKNLFLEFPKMPGSFMLHFDIDMLFSGITHLPGLGDVPGARCRHLEPGFSGARCSVSGDMKGGQVGYP